MIVYSDGKRRESVGSLVAEIVALASPAHRDVDADARWLHDLDSVRRLLIATGALEQAVHDEIGAATTDRDRSALTASRLATDVVAGLFDRVHRRCPHRDGVIDAAIQPVFDALAGVCDAMRGREVTVVAPEGFRFYTLYPEQYLLATDSWSAQHGPPTGDVLVIGLRSIGTTLSAVVRARLRADGWSVRRTTVRPTGPAFRRSLDRDSIDVTPADLPAASHVLVVDEGPGLSGSSMAAVAESLIAGGVEPSSIAFLPGHGHGPGPEASDAVRARWSSIPQFVARLDALRWHGRTVTELLVRSTRQLLDADEVAVTDDMSGGLWRRALFGDDIERWPEAFVPFERSKYRCVTADGRGVVWKYAGDDDAKTAREAGIRAARGCGPIVHGHVHGFVATTWVPGDVLQPADLDDGLLARIAMHMTQVAGRPQTAERQVRNIARLTEMLFVNAGERLGSRAIDRVRPLAAAVLGVAASQRWCTSGDGRMGPLEWRRLADGRCVKLNSVGHDRDHTAIGSQSIAWDVAGAIVEWQMTAAQRCHFVSCLAPELTGALEEPALRVHEMAYAAFCLGRAVHCLKVTDDAADRERLERAADRHTTVLATLI